MAAPETYRQKSRLFLLPLLGIKRNPVILPVDTYIIDKQKELSVSDRRLIVPFQKDESSEFADYENFLVGCDLFDAHNYYETKDYRVYVYNLSLFAKDFDTFISGKYTEFTKKVKTSINIYWGSVIKGKFEHHPTIQKYLNPTLSDYETLADELGVPVNYISQGGQILDRPNLRRETFYVKEFADEDRASKVE